MSGIVFYGIFILVTVTVAVRIKGVRQTNIYGTSSEENQELVNRICFCGLFLLLFLLSAMRYMTGHDYSTYVTISHDIAHGGYSVTELGFKAIVLFVYKVLNSENFLVVFAVFGAVMVLFFLFGIYKQSRDFGLTFFLYMAFGLYFQSFSTVRYYLAISVIFVSIGFFAEKAYIKGILFVLIASLFHKSALIVIPVYFLAGFKWKKIHVIAVTILASTGLVFHEYYLDLMLKLYPSYLMSGEYVGTGGLSIINVARSLAVCILGLYFWKDTVSENEKYGNENRFYFYLNYASLLYFLFFSFVPYGSRIGYYMNISHILYLPSIIRDIKDEKKKRIVKWAVILGGAAYLFVYLLRADNPGISVLPYRTWLFENVDFYSQP